MHKFFYPLLIVFFFSPLLSPAQTASLQSKAIVVKRMIEINHLAPRSVNDSFSATMFKKIIRNIDRRQLLFTDAEYRSLLAYNTTLDDELQGKNWLFLPALEQLYKKALLRADSIIQKQTAKRFDFTANETVISSNDESFQFSTDVAALSNRWSRYLKYKALDMLYDMITDDSTGKTTMQTVIASSESKVREALKVSESKSIKKIIADPSSHLAEIYLNALATGFDPHTNYFSPEDKEDFKEALSTEALSFGFSLDENDKGDIIIDQLTPGGPAWKSGDINAGDQLISLQWEGKEAVEMGGLTIEDAYDILEQSMNGRLVIKLRKTDGTVAIVLLRKEKIANEENIVKGFVLKGERKIGYILLPAFYTGWENETGSSCADDVAREIVKLKKENIDGLILDVRYNGGGSLGEAMQMTGIFIDEGPLMGQQQKDGKIINLKDPNRGTIYSGPMALMINGQSASASELLAACLQDYNRAVIVGSNSYGKATMQQMFSLDTLTKKPMITGSDKDMIKISMGKLYRLNGETAQLNGVSPDVVLPDAFDGIDYRERFSASALRADKIAKNNYYKPLPPLPVAALSQKSADRIRMEETFQNIKKVIEIVKARRGKNETIPLKSEAFEQWKRRHESELDMIKGEETITNKKFSVENHTNDKAILVNNEYAREINQNWLADIAEDIYIRETFLVLCDLIKLQKGI